MKTHTLRLSLALATSLVALVALARPAWADLPTLPPMFTESPDGSQQAGGAAGFAKVGEDYFVTVGVGTALRFGKLGLGVQVPLRLRVMDNDPKNSSMIRKEDWDEVADYTKILRFVEWGTPGNEGLYFRLGELAGTSIGNGTIVDRYYNTVDIDHYRTGLRVDYDAGAWGIQTMASSLTSAEVFALRPYFRPLLASGIPLVRTLTIAATVAMDVAAPDTIDVDPVTKKPLSDSKNNLKAQLKPAWVAGVGANLEVFRNPLIEVIPFTDLNSFEARGMGSLGWHLGTFINLHPIRDVLDVDTRWEYRRFGGHYQPGYFSTLYEVEKFSFLDGGPKAAFLRSAARDGISVNGFYGSLDVNVLRTIRITGIAEKYDQDKGGNVMLRLLLPYIANLQFSAYYTKRGFGKFVDAFDPDGAMAIGMLRYKLQGPLYLQGSYTRQWRLVPETGKYDTTDNFNLGVGVDFRF